MNRKIYVVQSMTHTTPTSDVKMNLSAKAISRGSNILRILLLALIMMCGTKSAMAETYDFSGAIQINMSFSQYVSVCYNEGGISLSVPELIAGMGGSDVYTACGSDNSLSKTKYVCVQYLTGNNGTLQNHTQYQWEDCSLSYNGIVVDFTQAINGNIKGAYVEFYIGIRTKDDMVYQIGVRVNGYLKAEGTSLISNTLVADPTTIKTGQVYTPSAHSSEGSTGAITYYGPFDTETEAENFTPSGSNKKFQGTTSSATGTYYFKAVQAATDGDNLNSGYASATTVTSVTVVDKTQTKTGASDKTVEVGNDASFSDTYYVYQWAEYNGGMQWMPLEGESAVTFSQAYTDAECTQIATGATQTSTNTNAYTTSKVGTYYVKITYPGDDTHAASSGVAKITVTPKSYTLDKGTNVGSTIYRSLPDGLDVSNLFSTTATDDALTYTLMNNATNEYLTLTDGKVLPTSMSKGTYTITCVHPSNDTYAMQSASVTLKIVGVLEKLKTYTRQTGTETMTYTIQDIMAGYDLEVPHTSSSYLTFTGIGTNNVTVDGTSYSPSASNDTPSSGYRQMKPTSDVTIVYPSTYSTSYYSYNTSNTFTTTYSMTDGYTYKYQNLFVSAGEFDKLRANITIKAYDPSGFWPVPENFNQTGNTDIADDVDTCPLTLGGTGTYGFTPKTNDDTDFVSGSEAHSGWYFNYYTTSTDPANGSATSVPTSGTYYKLVPQYGDMYLTVGIYLPKRKTFMLLDVDGSNIITSRTDLGSGLQGWRDVNGTISFYTETGHTYYFFSPDCPLGFYGYQYIDE